MRVLGHEKTVEARRFAGLEPTAHADAQRQLQEVLAILDEIHRRVARQATAAPAPRSH